MNESQVEHTDDSLTVSHQNDRVHVTAHFPGRRGEKPSVIVQGWLLRTVPPTPIEKQTIELPAARSDRTVYYNVQVHPDSGEARVESGDEMPAPLDGYEVITNRSVAPPAAEERS